MWRPLAVLLLGQACQSTELDPELDIRFQAELTAALEGIQALPANLGREPLDDETTAQVVEVQELLRTARATVDDVVLFAIGG